MTAVDPQLAAAVAELGALPMPVGAGWHAARQIEDLDWVRENVLPPAYRNETDWSCVCQVGVCWHCRDGQHDNCHSKTGWWRTGEAFRETEIADALGRRIGFEGSLVLVWLADRTCRDRGCPCDCRQEVAS